MKSKLIVLLVLINVTYSVFAIPTWFKFQQFHLNEKLPSNSVNRIFHDSEGYVWFGTRDGICKFDGYDIKITRSSALTPGKLSNNDIQYITEDSQDRIWVGTIEGVNIIDKKRFSNIKLQNPYVSKERINCIARDHEGMMWIGTSRYGVIKINPETEEYIRYSSDSDSDIKLDGNSVSYVYQDSKKRIWILNWSRGFGYLDTNKNIFVKGPTLGIKNNPFRIMEDSRGQLWICTWGDGIYKAKVNQNGTIEAEKFIPSAQSETNIDNITYSITEDPDKRIWIVTFTGLVYIEPDSQGDMNTVMLSGRLFDIPASQLFHTVISDKQGNIWLGSVGDGIYKMERKNISVKNYPLNEIKSSGAQSYVTRFCQTNSDEIFLVINRVGLFHFDRKTGQIFRPSDPVLRTMNVISAINNYKQKAEVWIANEGEKQINIFSQAGKELRFRETIKLPEIPQSPENSINVIRPDEQGNVWIGAQNAGLFLKAPFKPIELINSELNNINDIRTDSKKNIWVGTEKAGLFCLTARKNGSYDIRKITLMNGEFESLSIQSLLCKNEKIFIATKEGSLYLYDTKTELSEELSGSYGISEEGFMEIIDDNSGFIWLTTLKRIIRYNPVNHASIYFSTGDGLLISSLFKNSVIKLKSGELLFGGNNGVCEFNPLNLPKSRDASDIKVKITDILVQNKSLFDINDGKMMDIEKNKLYLKHHESNLSIEFSALVLSASGKIQYAYKMEGVDKDWIYVGNNRRFVTYSNLNPGSYHFKVKSSNENGVWSKTITSLKIIIKPPFYRSWWANLIYVLLLAGIIYLITKTIANRIRLRNELKISNIEKVKTEELTQIKLRYFTNISHELLTPLTIIMLQIESIQKKLTGNTSQFEIIKENAMRLKRLIRQILVFRKTESGNMKLKVLQDDIVAFVKNICQSNFSPQIEEKNINFTTDIEYESYLAWFDPDKLDKIIYNILSNAFKYTPKEGSIAVKMSFVPRNDEMFMRLSISDTGSGIHENDIPHIFKRFYISSSADQSQSHGIGLSLTQDLLDIHHGKIQVNSQLGEGSVFTIEIPVSENAYSANEKASDEDKEEMLISDNKEVVTEKEIVSESSVNEKTDSALNLLIVEDNKELNKLITEYFTEYYTVFSAENGLQALQIIRENEIDLIISDVMMPEMDGLTFCKIIKNDVNTSHIAVLMLTAKNSAEDRIDCYNAGADGYISKPFELAVLNARVRNLINKRLQKAEIFKHEHEITISSMEYNSVDELFLKQAVKKVEENLSDENFDFDQFAIELATSKSTLHRKLKTLTGLSPGEFIRNVRMKHAIQMLSNNIGNISEIAYAVGFNDPKYFSRCFKAEYNMTPKEWVEKHKK